MGAGILSTIRQVGSVMGISVLGAVLQNQLVSNVGNALAQIPQMPTSIHNQITEGLNSGTIHLGGASISGDIPASIQAKLTALFEAQFSNSLNTSMKVGIAILLIGTVASLFVSNRTAKSNALMNQQDGQVEMKTKKKQSI